MRLLDLFCGAGGCAVGYHRAGFTEIVGVDLKPMPRYPFTFVQGDALEYLAAHGAGFDAIHASPPCQAYTSMTRFGKRSGKVHPDLVDAVRDLLVKCGRPWVMENVPGSPLVNPVQVCGSAFGLGVRRHRLFESSIFLFGSQCQHGKDRPIAVYGDHPQGKADRSYRINRAHSLEQGAEAMGIDWMDWRTLTQAIPPSFTEYIGKQLIDRIRSGT